ncbi:AraC family transcriptional regulator [Paenibacillus taihuensis]|uniref:AraC family transcriptional regulator n=1 Tax=Paenibacillus taihuensis TaxID=1156355 RepID=A0A3D9SLQ9_9BACL|nr:AraC family transcriptional regulator [Paenibacillus taihuensis]REE92835.1 AraC family transcriptional regulator [Paenibacillus taihuensis]
MKGFGIYKSKKYLQRVLISIMLSMVIVLIALTLVNTYVLEQSVRRNQEQSNLKVLSQIQYNLSYMNEIISHLSNYVNKDNQIAAMLFDQKLPKMDWIRGYNRLSSYMDSSSFLHSIAVYNHTQNEIYATSTAFLLDDGKTKAKIRNWLFDPNEPHSTSRLIPVSLERDDGQIDVFAYLVTNSLKPFSRSESAIILYIKSDWVFNSLKKMDAVSSKEGGEIYIADQNGQLYSSDLNQASANAAEKEQIKQLVAEDKTASNKTSGFTVGQIDGQKKLVSYMDDGVRNWTIIYVQSYDKMMKDVRATRMKSIVIAVVFLLIAIGISIWLSYKLYTPIERMLRRIRLQQPDKQGGGGVQAAYEGDEFHLMSDNYMRLSHKLQEISSEQIVNKYYLRKFLTDSSLFTHHDMLELIQKHGLHISVSDEIVVCVLRIDNYASFDRNTTGTAKKMYSFAIVNIAQEIMSRAYPCEVVEVRGDHVVLIVSRGAEDEHVIFEQVVPLISEIQQTIEHYYSVSLSCGVSDPFLQFPYISTAYNQALQLCMYKIIVGNKAIITSDQVQPNLTNKQTAIPDLIERRLTEALKKGQMSEAGSELEKAFSVLANFQYDDMLRAVSNLAWAMKNAAAEIANNRVIKLDVDLEYATHMTQEKESLEEMYITLLSLCAKICEGQRPASMERNDMILETIKELIEQKYADINLSQQSIASTVKLTSAYIGKLFKDSTGVSITEYMNDVRLRHAQELLENDDYTVIEVMEKCGYGNPSYFFRLFKGKFGSTPKEYRMKKSIS